MSKNKTLNKFLKKAAKQLDKTRNPLDKAARFGVNTAEIGSRVVRDGISQAKIGADSLVDISTKRMDSAREERSVRDIIEAQLDATSSDMRKLIDVAKESIDIVADGLVDVTDEVSNTYDAYRADKKSGKFSSKAAA